MTDNDWNYWIYSSIYSPESQLLEQNGGVRDEMISIKTNLLRKYLIGSAVDMGCGIGEYTRIARSITDPVIGIDFSGQYVAKAQGISEQNHDGIKYLNEDIANTSLLPESIESIFSFSTLYYVPDVSSVIKHFRNLLHVGGVAILDFGNSNSLMNIFYSEPHRYSLAETYNLPIKSIHVILENYGFEIIENRSFQLLPRQGLSKKYFYLWPLTNKLWRFVLNCKINGITMDEITSSSILRKYAYRHLIVVRKK